MHMRCGTLNNFLIVVTSTIITLLVLLLFLNYIKNQRIQQKIKENNSSLSYNFQNDLTRDSISYVS